MLSSFNMEKTAQVREATSKAKQLHLNEKINILCFVSASEFQVLLKQGGRTKSQNNKR